MNAIEPAVVAVGAVFGRPAVCEFSAWGYKELEEIAWPNPSLQLVSI